MGVGANERTKAIVEEMYDDNKERLRPTTLVIKGVAATTTVIRERMISSWLEFYLIVIHVLSTMHLQQMVSIKSTGFFRSDNSYNRNYFLKDAKKTSNYFLTE